MEIVVNRYTLEYDVNAVVTLPNGSGNPIAFALGGSNVTSTSGDDASGAGGLPLRHYAVSDSDYNTTNNVIDGCDAGRKQLRRQRAKCVRPAIRGSGRGQYAELSSVSVQGERVFIWH